MNFPFPTFPNHNSTFLSSYSYLIRIIIIHHSTILSAYTANMTKFDQHLTW